METQNTNFSVVNSNSMETKDILLPCQDSLTSNGQNIVEMGFSQDHFLHAPIQMDMNFFKNLKKSYIIATNDFEDKINFLQNTYNSEYLRIFIKEELKIDDAHDIIKEAYIATSHEKIIAIFATSYNHFAQNALLKILEEPPKNVFFIFFITAKNKLIPTIFSRLAFFDQRKKNHIESFPLDIAKLNVPMVYKYIKQLEQENISLEKGRNLLHSLLYMIAQQNIELGQADLERFDIALQSLHVKQSVHLVLLPILLSLVKGGI
ncbi:DNA polymerase III subunit delta [Helicobacter didelphidarum]|uniref:DNA polymerase III subunit delta n=1 Tax=Helicobacter didelphidarum TaxID=2040648 RepID=A0A3D8ILQ4_9HELI|nr:DNA polymerase III subunit delta' [Helicobacter didelphidarum]RDU66112.1 DNA polymerase III subunit delta [Helicobacter didelphidarum]